MIDPLAEVMSLLHVYSKCPYIKVNVRFKAATTVSNGVEEDSDDIIESISQSILAWRTACECSLHSYRDWAPYRRGFGLETSDLSSDCRIIRIERSIWRGQEQLPKTTNAIRAVDVPETLAQVPRSFVAGRNGYLFAPAKGRPLQHRNVLRALHGTKKIGLHAFRRFRLTWLRKNGVPKDLEHFWMGHADEEVGDLYSKLKEDEPYRQHWAERIGLGFAVGQLGPLNVVSISEAKVA